ncbi:MAG TPA: transposase, partial [Verrucomicrobiae bacterium]|nr:transposase [Verrucomicrobiae bacterium]
MNEEVVARKKRKPSPPLGGWREKKSHRFSPKQELLAVWLRLEEGFELKNVCAEAGVAQGNLSRWIRQYPECVAGCQICNRWRSCDCRFGNRRY